jgi:hypothetical protein
MYDACRWWSNEEERTARISGPGACFEFACADFTTTFVHRTVNIVLRPAVGTAFKDRGLAEVDMCKAVMPIVDSLLCQLRALTPLQRSQVLMPHALPDADPGHGEPSHPPTTLEACFKDLHGTCEVPLLDPKSWLPSLTDHGEALLEVVAHAQVNFCIPIGTSGAVAAASTTDVAEDVESCWLERHRLRLLTVPLGNKGCWIPEAFGCPRSS